LFGEWPSVNAFEKAVAAAISKRDEAFAAVEGGWRRGDIRLHPTVGDNTNTVASFNLTGSEVFLGDGRDLASRLVNWRLAQPA
jgi:hypothetical protein